MVCIIPYFKNRAKIKILSIISFSHHLRHSLAKFQLHRTSRSKSLGKSVFRRYREFKFRNLFFTKICPFSLNIFQNPKYLPDFIVFYGLVPGHTWKTTPNHFRLKYSRFWLILSIIFILGNSRKRAIFVIPSRTWA